MNSDEAPRLAPLGHDARMIAVSPDGRWIATSGESTKIWDAESAMVVHEIPGSIGWSDVRFSENGQWLTTSSGSHRLWRVGTWELQTDLGPTVNPTSAGAFASPSPNTNFMAALAEDATFRLLDPATGHEKARLTNSLRGYANYGKYRLTPDGRKLIATNNDSHTIDIWDLAALRSELSHLELDWDDPPYPQVIEPAPIRELRVVGPVTDVDVSWAKTQLPLLTKRLEEDCGDVDAAFRRSQAYLHLGDSISALEDLEYAVELGLKILDEPTHHSWLHPHWLQWRNRLAAKIERLRLDPHNTDLLVSAALDAIGLQQYDAALNWTEEALWQSPNGWLIHRIKAHIRLFGPPRLQDLEQGLHHADFAYRHDSLPFNATTLAAAYYRTGHLAKAKEMLAVKVQGPNTMHAAYLLALVTLEEGDVAKARESYVNGCKLLEKWRSSALFLELTEANRLRKEFEAALQAYDVKSE